MLRVGFVGWRGMVSSVLIQRMQEENDFAGIESFFFSTSNIGGAAPKEACDGGVLNDARDLSELRRCEILFSCQGGEYTTEIYGPLRKSGWKGFWIDAASTLRMSEDSVIILDPVNAEVIRDGLTSGLRTFVGGNCTVSLMLMAVSGLLRAESAKLAFLRHYNPFFSPELATRLSPCPVLAPSPSLARATAMTWVGQSLKVCCSVETL